MIGLQDRPIRKAGILSQQASDTQLLLNLDDGQYYALDEVGIRIWELCDGQSSVAQIVSTIAREYEAPVEIIEADTVELLKDLADAKLVTKGA